MLAPLRVKRIELDIGRFASELLHDAFDLVGTQGDVRSSDAATQDSVRPARFASAAEMPHRPQSRSNARWLAAARSARKAPCRPAQKSWRIARRVLRPARRRRKRAKRSTNPAWIAMPANVPPRRTRAARMPFRVA